jgi:hypothetical protein
MRSVPLKTASAMRSRRVVAFALMPFAVTMLAIGQSAAPNGFAAADHVPALAGSWTCRSLDQTTMHEVGTRDGDVISVRSQVQPARGRASVLPTRYEFKPAQNRWTVTFAPGTDFGITGEAGPWTGDEWVVDGRDKNGQLARIVVDLLPGGDVTRTYLYQKFVNDPELGPKRAERCSLGDVPPAADACIVKNFPPTVVSLAPMMRPDAPDNAWVNITVSLDADSRVTATRVQASKSALLNEPAQIAVRRSAFRTAIRNCKPVPSEMVIGY